MGTEAEIALAKIQQSLNPSAASRHEKALEAQATADFQKTAAGLQATIAEFEKLKTAATAGSAEFNKWSAAVEASKKRLEDFNKEAEKSKNLLGPQSFAALLTGSLSALGSVLEKSSNSSIAAAGSSMLLAAAYKEVAEASFALASKVNAWEVVFRHFEAEGMKASAAIRDFSAAQNGTYSSTMVEHMSRLRQGFYLTREESEKVVLGLRKVHLDSSDTAGSFGLLEKRVAAFSAAGIFSAESMVTYTKALSQMGIQNDKIGEAFSIFVDSAKGTKIASDEWANSLMSLWGNLRGVGVTVEQVSGTMHHFVAEMGMSVEQAQRMTTALYSLPMGMNQGYQAFFGSRMGMGGAMSSILGMQLLNPRAASAGISSLMSSTMGVSPLTREETSQGISFQRMAELERAQMFMINAGMSKETSLGVMGLSPGAWQINRSGTGMELTWEARQRGMGQLGERGGGTLGTESKFDPNTEKQIRLTGEIIAGQKSLLDKLDLLFKDVTDRLKFWLGGWTIFATSLFTVLGVIMAGIATLKVGQAIQTVAAGGSGLTGLLGALGLGAAAKMFVGGGAATEAAVGVGAATEATAGVGAVETVGAVGATALSSWALPALLVVAAGAAGYYYYNKSRNDAREALEAGDTNVTINAQAHNINEIKSVIASGVNRGFAGYDPVMGGFGIAQPAGPNTAAAGAGYRP